MKVFAPQRDDNSLRRRNLRRPRRYPRAAAAEAHCGLRQAMGHQSHLLKLQCRSGASPEVQSMLPLSDRIVLLIRVSTSALEHAQAEMHHKSRDTTAIRPPQSCEACI